MASATPRATRAKTAPERIEYAFAESSFGRLLLAQSDRGLVSLEFVDSDAAALAELEHRFRGAILEPADPGRAAWIADAVALTESLDQLDDAGHIKIDLDLRGTPFQRSVWDALLAIPSGETRTYSEVARSIGRPTAVRAVAQACGANPVAIIVPCHRVIGADGSLTGYASGLDRKRDLLAREHSPAGV